MDFGGFGPSFPHSDYVRFLCGLEKMRINPFVTNKSIDILEDEFIQGYGKKFNSEGTFYKLYRLPYVLDQMGDILIDWKFIPVIKRPLYKKLYKHYLTWLQQTLEE